MAEVQVVAVEDHAVREAARADDLGSTRVRHSSVRPRELENEWARPNAGRRRPAEHGRDRDVARDLRGPGEAVENLLDLHRTRDGDHPPQLVAQRQVCLVSELARPPATLRMITIEQRLRIKILPFCDRLD